MASNTLRGSFSMLGYGTGTRHGADTSRKMGINTDFRGPLIPEMRPVQKIRDKSPPPPFGTRLEPVLKGPRRGHPRDRRAGDLWHRFVT
jgi:hypothetical protein